MILAILALVFVFFWDIFPLMRKRITRDAAVSAALFLIASYFLIRLAAGSDPPSLMEPFIALYKKGVLLRLPGFE